MAGQQCPAVLDVGAPLDGGLGEIPNLTRGVCQHRQPERGLV